MCSGSDGYRKLYNLFVYFLRKWYFWYTTMNAVLKLPQEDFKNWLADSVSIANALYAGKPHYFDVKKDDPDQKIIKMVQIIIESTLGKSQNSEWCIIELQGDLETHGEKLDPGTLIGDIHFTKNGIPILIIGHHILYGKVMDIEKPLVVLLKNTEKVSYTATAFIRKKLLFKTRPKPIISYVTKKV